MHASFCYRYQTLAEWDATNCNLRGSSILLRGSQSLFLSSRGLPTSNATSAPLVPADATIAPYYSATVFTRPVVSLSVTLTRTGVSASTITTALAESAVVSSARFSVTLLSGTTVSCFLEKPIGLFLSLSLQSDLLCLSCSLRRCFCLCCYL